MRYLNAQEVYQATSYSELITAAEKALVMYAQGNFVMPLRMHVNQAADTLLLMPCFVPDGVGTKLVSVNPGNPPQGLPLIHGLMVLNDGETGRPLAIMHAGALTALRTSAMGAASIRHMAPPTITRLGIIGSGVQGYYQTRFACEVRDIQEITIWNRTATNAYNMARQLQQDFPRKSIQVVPNSTEVLKASQVVITTTASPDPVLPNESDLLMHKHFVAVGSYLPHMRELPEALFHQVQEVIVDTYHAIEESGDLAIPLQKGWIQQEQIKSLGDVILGASISGSTTLFKSVGMAILDVVAAQFIYAQAQEKELGTVLEL